MITNNNPGGKQVFCHQSALGNVNHNYWGGENVFPSSASENCTFDDNKRLGAEPRQLSAGIAGEYINLERIYSDPFLVVFPLSQTNPAMRFLLLTTITINHLSIKCPPKL